MTIAISLGYNCRTSQLLVSNKWRETKAEGYNTCPFDLCIAPYEGVVSCILDDFRDFLNPAYLRMQTVPSEVLGTDHSEELLYNTKYGFVFLHESPGHANLYETEMWPGGKYHFVADNWAKFRERYARRIENFKAYIHSGQLVQFCIGAPSSDLRALETALRTTYPRLRFTVFPIEIDSNHYESILRYSAYISPQ